MDTYFIEIKAIAKRLSEKYVNLDNYNWQNTWGLDEELINRILSLINVKKNEITEFELDEAKVNYITPIRKLKISYEDQLVMTSIYYEAMKYKQKLEVLRSFEKYNSNQPIFGDKKLLDKIHDDELINYTGFKLHPTTNYVKYNNCFFKTDYMTAPLLNYIDKMSKNYPTFIRLDPYYITTQSPQINLQEQLIQPLKYNWIHELNLYKGEITGGNYILPDLPLSQGKHTEEEQLHYWEYHIKKVRSLDVSAERTYKESGNLRMMVEEITEDKEINEYYRTKIIHLDTDDEVGTAFEKSTLNHIDLAVNLYNEQAYQARLQKYLRNGVVQNATIRTHLIRFEKVPFKTLFDLATLFFDSKILLNDWFADLKINL